MNDNIEFNYTLVQHGPTEFTYQDLIANHCLTLEGMVINAVVLILFSWVMTNIFLPLSRDGLLETPEVKQILPDNVISFLETMYNYLISLFETFILGSGLYLAFFVYYQEGFTLIHKIFIIIGLVIIGLRGISLLIGWFRK